MVTATNIATAGNDAGGTNYGIPTFTRTATRPYLVAIFSAANVTGDIPVLATIGSPTGTWTRLAGGQMSSGGGEFYRIDVFGHVPTVTDPSTDLSITYTSTQLGVLWSIVELGGMPDDSAHNGALLWPSPNVVYDDTANTQQTSNTVTLPSAGATIVFAGQPDNNGFTLEGGYTEVAETIRTSPLRTMTAGFLNAADTSVVATVTGGGTAKIGMIGIALVTVLVGPLSITLPLMSTPTVAPSPIVALGSQTLVLDVLSTPTIAPTPTVGEAPVEAPLSGLYVWTGTEWERAPGFSMWDGTNFVGTP